MDADRWRKAREWFERLADEPPQSWAPRLAAECDDAEVRAEALALLRADAEVTGHTALAAQAPELIDAAAAQHERARDARLVGRRLGAFELLREIGRGGMGQVWLARRADGQFEQQVAIKLLRHGWDDTDALARFRAERQILASLTHPNIAHLVDGGVDDEGRPWLALEYVDGSDLRAHCDARTLDLPARLRLLLTVCDAVAYAHARLVVHRDIKPSNLLVDADGKVKLLDFGIAKLIEGDSAASATRLFTPEYAAPEQVRGEAVTTAVDVYALGLLLYELLTGRRPYKLENSTPAAYERAILDQEPTRPSLAVTRRDENIDADALAARRDLTPQRLRRELRGDLDAIVLKALRKEPAQRYASVAEFADDIKRYLDCQPVQARRGNWRYRAARFVQRHTLAAGLALIALLSLVGGLGAALWQAREARAERDRAETQAESARRIAAFLQGVFENANPEKRPGETVTAQQLLAEGSRAIHDDRQLQPEVRASLLETLGRSEMALDEVSPALPLLEEAVELRAAGEDRNAESRARSGLARALMLLKRFDESEAQLVQARDRADRSLRSGAEAHATAIATLGNLRINTHKHEDAIATLRQAMDLQRDLYGEDDAQTLDTLVMLAYVLAWEDRTQEAFALIDPQWQRVAARTQPGDLQRRSLLNAEAEMLKMLQRYAEAVPLAEEDLALQERIYGRQHRNYRIAQQRLGITLYKANRPAEALPLLAEAVATIRALPEDRELTDFAFSLRDYARVLDAVGRSADAVPLFEESLQRMRNRQPPKPVFQANILIGLIRAERHAGRLGAAMHHLAEGKQLDPQLDHARSERTSLMLEQTRLSLDQHVQPPDCAAAERAVQLRKDAGDPLAMAEAQAVVVACQIVAGRRDDVAATIPALIAARDSHHAIPPEAEALDYALRLWQAGEASR